MSGGGLDVNKDAGPYGALSCRAKVQLDMRQKLWMALDVAKGMHYLHSCRPPIVHGGGLPILFPSFLTALSKTTRSAFPGALQSQI